MPLARRARIPEYAVEPLEQRMLLAGVTLITHGYSDNATGWVEQMANAIISRAGLSTNTDATEYIVTVKDPDHDANSSDTTGPLSVTGVKLVGPDPSSTSDSDPEIFILLDWSAVAGHFGGGGLLDLGYTRSTSDVAAAVSAQLLQPGFLPGFAPAAATLPIDVIGHSRGASLVAELAGDLGQCGVWVDQVTTLDPHPVPLFGDPGPTESANIYDNVVFADNYYQDTFYIGGSTVTGALNFGPLSLPGGYGFPAYEHNNVHAFYYGTIDTSLNANDGPNGTGISIPDSWYGLNNVSRSQTGFYYNRLSGQNKPHNGLGTGQLFGGIEPRVGVTHSNIQWPNVGFLNLGGTTQLTIGQTVNVSFTYEDYGKSSDVVLFLDTDQNPYDGFVPGDPNNVIGPDPTTRASARGYDPSLPSADSPTSSADVTPLTLDTSGVSSGTYYLCAEIKDNDYRR